MSLTMLKNMPSFAVHCLPPSTTQAGAQAEPGQSRAVCRAHGSARVLESREPYKPGQSRGFQAEPGRHITNPDAVADMVRIEEAARLGGSLEFIQKCARGFDDIIDPVATSIASDCPMDNAALKSLLDDVRKSKNISGEPLFFIT